MQQRHRFHVARTPLLLALALAGGLAACDPGKDDGSTVDAALGKRHKKAAARAAVVNANGGGGGGASSGDLAIADLHAVPKADWTPTFGTGLCTQRPYDLTDADLDAMAGYGFGCNRYVIDPTDPSVDNRNIEIAQKMGAHGQTAFFILMSDVNHPPSDDAGRQAFAQGAARAVSAVHHGAPGVPVVWEIWNEPNGQNFWRTGPNAEAYAAMAQVAAPQIHSAISAAGGRGMVIGPAIGDVYPGVDDGFFRAIFHAQPSLVDEFDAISVHGYHQQEGPEAMLSSFSKAMASLPKAKPWSSPNGDGVSTAPSRPRARPTSANASA